MSYLGYTGILTRYLGSIKHPMVLEIGVDRGQTSLPLISNLVHFHGDNFKWVGVDVRWDDMFMEQVCQMSNGGINIQLDPDLVLYQDSWNCSFQNQNSLSIMPDMVRCNFRFDAILIDGDHNYSTVSKELEYASQLSHESTILLVDDYNGKWSDQDLFYKDRKSHSDNELLEKQASVERQGVNAAVDDWLDKNPEWTMIDRDDDCVILHRKTLELKLIPDLSLIHI